MEICCQLWFSTILSLDARQIYMEKIMDWTDHFTENLQSNPDGDLAKQAALDSICKLWIQYVGMESTLRQFKTAIQIFDNALNDPVAKGCVQIYLAFAEYCKERKKVPKAQKVYISGINAGLKQFEIDLLWKEFLLTVRTAKSTELTLKELYEAANTETGQLLPPPSSFDESILFRKQQQLLVDVPLSSANSISSPESKILLKSHSMHIEERHDGVKANNGHNSYDRVIGNSLSTSTAAILSSSSSSGSGSTAGIHGHGHAAAAADVASSVAASSSSSSSGSANGGGGSPTASITIPLKTSLPLWEDMTGYTPEQLCRIYIARPEMLFSSPNKVRREG